MYSLILLDFSMPILDGPQTARQIRYFLKEANLPMPFTCCCSAYAEVSFKRIALNDGMDYFLVKPIAYDDFLKMIKVSTQRRKTFR